MKRVVLAVLLMLFAAFAALWTYVQSEAFSERIRPWIIGPVQEALGPSARIGRVKATLLPLVLEIRDISLSSARSAEAVAVRKVRFYLNPLKLLFRIIDVTSVTVLEPRLDAQRGTDGTVDLQDLLRAVLENIARRSGRGEPSYALQVRSVAVRNGSARIADASSGITVSASGMDLRTTLSTEAPSGVLRVTAGRILVTSPSYPPVEADVLAEGSFGGGKASISHLEIRGRTGRISASGAIGLGQEATLDLRITGRTIAGAAGLIRRQAERRPSLEAAASVTGSVRDPRIEGSLRLGDASLGGMVLANAGLRFTYAGGAMALSGKDWLLELDGRKAVIRGFRAEAGYRDGILRIVTASLQADDSSVHISGTADATKGLHLSLSADIAEGGAMPFFLTGLDASGAASIKGTLSGVAKDLRFDGTLSAGPVALRGTTFQSLTGSVRFRDRTLSLDGAAIRHGESRYLFDGSVGFAGQEPQFAARLGVIRSDVVGIVALFYKPIPLVMDASGELFFTGTRREFRGTGQLSLEAGSAYGESFDRGSLSAELTSDRIVFTRIMLEKGGGQVTGQGWIGFDGSYAAQVQANGVDAGRIDHLAGLDLAGPVGLSIQSSGAFTAPVVSAQVASRELTHRALGSGAFAGELAISERRMTISASFDGGPDRSAALQGVMRLGRSYPWTASGTFRARDADPSLFSSASDVLEKIRLSAEGAADLEGEGLDPDRISGAAVLHRLALEMQEYRVENEGDALIRVERGGLAVKRLQLVGAGTRMSVSGSAHPRRTVDLTLDGDVNLSLVRLMYREVEHGDGVASLSVSLREKWDSPELEGRLTIRDGLIKIRDVPQKFSSINGTLQLDRKRIVTERLTADAGGGRIEVAGSAQLRGTSLVEFSVRAAVESVTVRYPPGLTAALGGTLFYDGDASAQVLSGELVIQRARYDKRIEWKSMLVDVTRGITRRKKADIGWIGDTRLNVRFSGSEQILFENNLAKIPLAMDMLFRGTVNQLQVLGRIEAREGEVYFRNNVFRIQYASTDFVDPNRLNPVLDVQAETRVRDYRIRLAVSGTADRAVVTFLSDPPLADSDILALLALGRKGEELKGREANIGMGESLSFATGKFQDLLESRARSITGLDRFQVDPYINQDDTAVPRVTVGKELMPERFFMTYSSNVGGTTPEQNVRVEYILNRNLSLIGEYDELGQIGADLKLRFEFR